MRTRDEPPVVKCTCYPNVAIARQVQIEQSMLQHLSTGYPSESRSRRDATRMWGIRQVRHAFELICDGRSSLESGVVISKLLLTTNALGLESFNGLLRLFANLPHRFRYDGGIAADALDLFDHELSNATRAPSIEWIIPCSLLGGVAVGTVASALPHSSMKGKANDLRT